MVKSKYYIMFMIILFSAVVIATLIDSAVSHGENNVKNDAMYVISYSVILNVVGSGCVADVAIKYVCVFSGLAVILTYGLLRLLLLYAT